MSNMYTYKKIHILNLTKCPKISLHKIIDFCRPPQLKNKEFNLIVLYHSGYRKTLEELDLVCPLGLNAFFPFGGVAVQSFLRQKRGWHPISTIIVTITERFRPSYSKPNRKAGYIKYYVGDKVEALISTLSHEMRHIVDFNNFIRNTPKRETICDRFAIKTLKRWRRRKL